MFENIFNSITDTVSDGVNRLFDKEIRIGVTGLSRGGKTAFITSLVNTVLNFGSEGMSDRLSRFTAYEKSGIYYGGMVQNHDLSVPVFPYYECCDALFQKNPCWPKPTDNISEIRLEIRYKDDRFYVPGEHRNIYIDIWDYPGEWLMDLMLLNMDYEEFSARMRQQVGKLTSVISSTAPLLEFGKILRPDEPLNQKNLKEAVDAYVQWLRECKQHGFALIVPGRFVLPGNLDGAPIIEFIPWLWERPEPQRESRNSLYGILKSRYEAYRSQIVEKFYNDSFSKLDRQIILIDCFKALKGGRETFDNINDTFEVLLNNFNYGSNNILTRLFSPNIDKVIFAATKADQITIDEQKNLLSLLKSMVTSASRKVRGDGINCQYMVLSSIAASKCKMVNYNGENIQVLCTDYEDDKPYYPGEIPPNWSQESMEAYQQYFKFRELKPPRIDSGELIPNMNMDILLQYILGDKL
jgi:predicted YcjX-like family ATPase